MFPQGGPGLALFLLRGSILASFVAIASRHSSVAHTSMVVVGVALVSLCLITGFATPVISVIAAVAAVADMLVGARAQGFIVSSVLLLDAAALALLGPGAYSIDARLFGRRVTVLPARSDTDD
jgi:hypothetical protein